ncbi:5688_t:CDS:2 [Ambispora gerdemannii]|uniref:5688_t:CDS:1 n=1 Tax=Ambispora gerdemannii TaxID=144530 RepID=A0A9N9F3L0_9GLOM|nr:5688_t:CDS:2 [Ambispora gerdemannii]
MSQEHILNNGESAFVIPEEERNISQKDYHHPNNLAPPPGNPSNEMGSENHLQQLSIIVYKGNNTCENNGLEIITKNEATGSTESIKYNDFVFDRENANQRKQQENSWSLQEEPVAILRESIKLKLPNPTPPKQQETISHPDSEAIMNF